MTDTDCRTPTELPADTRVGEVALRVNDRNRMTEFYRDVVGLDVLAETAGQVTLGVDDSPLLRLLVAPEAPSRAASAVGLFHVAFRVPSRAALGDALERVRTRWHLDGASDHHVSEALYFSDPEDNGIEIYRDRPRTEWPLDEDGRVEMDTLPLDLDAIADRAAGNTGVPVGTTVGHVHLEVSSLADARAFYVDTLGLQVRQEWGPSALFVAAGEYHHHVGLNTWNDRTAPADDGRGLAWFELVVPDRGVLEATRDRLEATDVSVLSVEDGIEITDIDGITTRVVVGS